MRKYNHPLLKGSASLLVVTIMLAGAPVFAQQPGAAGGYNMSIPAKPLLAALADFTAATGIQIVRPGGAPIAGNSAPVSGTLPPGVAIDRLLSGTGLSWRLVDRRTIALYRPGEAVPVQAVADGSTALETVTVEGDQAWGPVGGLVATQTGAATKTGADVLTLAQSVTTVSREQVEKQGARTVEEALNYSSGINTQIAGLNNSQDILSIRGFSGENQYLDGLSIPMGTLTGARIEPYGLERLDLVRGPSSSLYGEMPPGGIVSMTSKRPTGEPFREVRLQYGNNGQASAAFDLSGPVDPDRTLLYRLTGLTSLDGTQVDFEDRKRIFVAPAFTWKPDEDTSFTLLGQYQKDRGLQAFQVLPVYGTLWDNPGFGSISPDLYHGEPSFDRYIHEQWSVGYAFEHRFDETFTIRQNLQSRRHKVDSHAVSSATLDPGTSLGYDRWLSAETQDDSVFAVDTSLEAKFDTGPFSHTALLGIDYRRSTGDYTFATDGGAAGLTLDFYNPVYSGSSALAVPLDLWSHDWQQQRQIGVYAQDQIEFGGWTLVASGRQDWADGRSRDEMTGIDGTPTRNSRFTGRLGLSYLFDNGIAPYASVSSSFNPLSGSTFDGAPFEPTTALQYEAGIKYRPEAFDALFSASVFEITQQNILTPDPDAVHIAAMPWAKVQLGEGRVRGLELEARGELGHGFSLIGAYTYLQSEITRGTGADTTIGNDLPTTPRHQAALWLDYTAQDGALEGVSIGGGLRYKGANYGDADNVFKAPGVLLADAAIRYDFKALSPDYEGLTFALNASNLLDKVYVANCQSEISCSFGSRRSVVATLNYQW